MGLPSSLAQLYVTVQFLLNSFRASAAHVHKSTARMFNLIPEPVGFVGNAFHQVGFAFSSSLNSAARRERPTLPALRVASEGPAPRLGRPLVHIQWGVAPRAPVQGRCGINQRRAIERPQ
jgi:hypothetical protein